VDGASRLPGCRSGSVPPVEGRRHQAGPADLRQLSGPGRMSRVCGGERGAPGYLGWSVATPTDDVDPQTPGWRVRRATGGVSVAFPCTGATSEARRQPGGRESARRGQEEVSGWEGEPDWLREGVSLSGLHRRQHRLYRPVALRRYLKWGTCAADLSLFKWTSYRLRGRLSPKGEPRRPEPPRRGEGSPRSRGRLTSESLGSRGIRCLYLALRVRVSGKPPPCRGS
jgi:hypothetical protein